MCGALLPFPSWPFVGIAMMLTQSATLIVFVEPTDPSTDGLMGITVSVLAPVFTVVAGLGHTLRVLLHRDGRTRT